MSLSRIRVKMCGMTRIEDVQHAVSIGVDAIGLIFYSKSARNVSLRQAKELIQDLPPFINTVAVLVNPEPEFVQDILTELPVQLLQFHGDETPGFCNQFNRPYIKAVHPVSREQVTCSEEEYLSARALILDTPSVSSRGGTGQIFDWSLIPETLSKPFILAGGINELNVLAAIKRCSPFAVDVCSGVESQPGIKDHDKMSRFIKTLRGDNE